MERLSRITRLMPFYRSYVPGMGIGGGGGSARLTPHQVEKATLLERYFSATVKCLKLGRELAWEVLGKFGNKLTERIDYQIRYERQKCHAMNFHHPGLDVFPSIEKLEAIARISIENKDGIVREVGGLSDEERNNSLRYETPPLILQILRRGHDSNWLAGVRENIFAYYVYEQKVYPFLFSGKFDGSEKLDMGNQFAEILIKLGQPEKALSLISGLLEKSSVNDCIVAEFSNVRNYLLEMLPVLKKLIPEIHTEEGLELMIRRFQEIGPSAGKEDMIVNAGFMYPFASSADPRIALLLKLGRTLFEMHQDRDHAFSLLREYWEGVRKFELGVKVVLIKEIIKHLRDTGLVPKSVLEDLQNHGEINGLPKPVVSFVVPVKFQVIALPKTSPAPPEAVTDPAAISLRDKVRRNGLLLFTRNIPLKEFEDIAHSGKLQTARYFVKYFRYGLGHEYGEEGAVIVVVMKRSFWEAEKEKSALVNPFLSEVNGKAFEPKLKPLGGGSPGRPSGLQRVYCDYTVEGVEARERMLKGLAGEADYNRNLNQKPSEESYMQKMPAVAQTIAAIDREGYMGLYPQLEVTRDVPLDQVEKILVPEHMWEAVSQAARKNPQIAKLLCKVESGRTKEEFLSGRERMGRRSRLQGGSIEPNFGYDSFFRFEQAYFGIVLGEPETFVSKAKAVFHKYGYEGAVARGWLWAAPEGETCLERKENDWKIFVNPREEHFVGVLEVVLSVLSQKDLGIGFKIPPDLSEEWRPGRKFGASSNTPKIIIYADAKTLPAALKTLDEELGKAYASAGFGGQPGPSFARRFGRTDLLSYKMEYFSPRGDERAGIADEAEWKARAAGITDPEKILELKKNALIAAGFDGENYYKRVEDPDPLVSLP